MLRSSIAIFLLAIAVCYGQTANPVANTNKGLPIFDPSSESVSFGGQTFLLKDNRIHLHFVSYLISENYKQRDVVDYYDTLSQMKSILDPRSNHSNPVKAAYQLLRTAAKYDGDHNVSESLGAAVAAALNAQETIRKRNQKASSLKKAAVRIERKMHLIETETDLTTRRKVGETPPPKKVKKASTEYQELARQRAEINAQLKKISLDGVTQVKIAKVEFQAILVQLFLQRRFEHVLIGTRFYMQIFEPTDTSLDLKENSIVADFFKNSVGVPPTVIGLESITHEMIGKVQNLVKQADKHTDLQQLHSASGRLLEAYALGEHLTFIQTLPSEKKLKLYDYNHISNSLLDAIDARDFDLANQLNQRLKSIATDYQHARIEGYIQGFVKASNSHATNARLYLTEGNKKAMFNEINNAKSLWPLNPSVKEILVQLNESISSQEQKLNKYQLMCDQFDKLVVDQKFLLVLSTDNWKAFATLFHIEQDTLRLTKLNEISEKYEPVIIGLSEATALSERKLHVLAWEKCKGLYEKFPHSIELKEELSQYRQKAGTYVKLLEEAKSLISEGHTGSALSCYLKAQQISAEGELATHGIEYLMSTTIR